MKQIFPITWTRYLHWALLNFTQNLLDLLILEILKFSVYPGFWAVHGITDWYFTGYWTMIKLIWRDKALLSWYFILQFADVQFFYWKHFLTGYFRDYVRLIKKNLFGSTVSAFIVNQKQTVGKNLIHRHMVKRPRVKYHRVKRHKVKRPRVKRKAVKNATKGKGSKSGNNMQNFFRLCLVNMNYFYVH